MKKQIALTEEQLQSVVAKAAIKYLMEMKKNEKKDCCDKNTKKKITLSESQLQDVVLKVANRMIEEGYNTEKENKEKTQKKYDVCERTKGGMFLCKNNGKWALFDKNMKRISDWENNKDDAKK